MDKIKQRRKEEEDWRKTAARTINIYEAKQTGDQKMTAFNILHANTQVEVPALFNSMPVPDIRKRYSAEVEEVDEDVITQQVTAQFQEYQAKKAAAQQQAQMQAQQMPQPGMGHNGPPPDQQQPDQADPQAELQQAIDQAIGQAKKAAEEAAEKEDKTYKRASDTIERCLMTTFDLYPFDDMVEDVVTQHLLTGRGQARVRYDPDIFTYSEESSKEEKEAVGIQKVYCELVAWDDYVHGSGKVWEHVTWEAFRHNLPEDEVRQKLKDFYTAMEEKDLPQSADGKPIKDDTFDGKVDDQVEKRIEKLGFGDSKKKAEAKSDEASPHGLLTTIEVWEFWDRNTRKVWWITDADKELPINITDDPLGLRDFFPTPRPLRRIRRASGLTPMTPYTVYESLAQELDEVCRRITDLIKSVRSRGLVDPILKEAMSQFETMADGEYATGSVGATSWLQGGQKTLSDLIHHFPMDDAIKALAQLYNQRELIKQTIYEVTGISDVLRGATDPNETLGAQQLKANYGSQRTQNGQKAVANFARDLMRLKTEIICNHFEPQNIEAMSGIKMRPETLQIIRDRASMIFRIDIETDSTIRADIVRNQDQWTQFLNGVSQFVSGFGPLGQMMPKVAPHLMGVFGALVGRMKLGRQAEDAIQKMIEAAEEFADGSPVVGQQQSGPSPEELKQVQQQHDQQMQMMQADSARADEQHQMLKDQHAMDMQLKQADLANKQVDAQSKPVLAQLTIEQKQAEAAATQAKVALDQQNAGQKMAVEEMKGNVALQKAHADITKSQIDLEGHHVAAQHDILTAKINAAAANRKAAFEAHGHSLKAKGEEMRLAHEADKHAQALKHAEALAKQKAKQHSSGKK